ncbi:MAG TPA: shikimate kinase [Terriglobales bacterium]|nr:shikimate kinase [Terriglobales bacterium]
MRPGGEPECGKHPEDGSASRLVFLVGFMGAGKTSVGRMLSRFLGWDFEDLDDQVVAREQRSIEEIFRESGEAAFRRAESQALGELLARARNCIIALGGGAYVQPEIAALIKESGSMVIFLDATVDDLLKRCDQQPVVRPLRRDPEQFRSLYEARRPHYLRATLRIETSGKDVEAVSREIASKLQSRSF